MESSILLIDSQTCLIILFKGSMYRYYAPINVKPEAGRGGGGWGAYVGHLIFFKEFLIKTSTLGSKKWLKSGQISLPWRQIVLNIRISGRAFVNFTTL